MMPHVPLRFLFLALTLMILSCKEASKKTVKTEKISFTKEGDLTIFDTADDTPIVDLDIELATTDYEIQTGLMYRTEMAGKQGMLFIFQEEALHSFYMKNTRIPLDIIYIDGSHKIASFQKNAQPMDERGLSSKVPIQFVLEVNAGMADQWGLALGDSIAYTLP